MLILYLRRHITLLISPNFLKITCFLFAFDHFAVEQQLWMPEIKYLNCERKYLNKYLKYKMICIIPNNQKVSLDFVLDEYIK